MDVDITTRYMGLELRNPIVASAGPFGRTVDGVKRLADVGVGAVVLSSLFEEQFEQVQENPRAPDRPPPGGRRRDPSGHLQLIERSASSVEVPVIASLNGCSTGGWTDYATAMERAGASAIELNLYFPQADPLTPGRDLEEWHAEVLGTVKAAVSIPVAVKIAPYFSSPGEVALRLDRVGADGLVLFNRFMQAGIDPETLQVDAGFELSRPQDAAFARTWIALLRGRVGASLAASSGVDGAADVAAYLLAGADVVMTTSALLRYGPEHVEKLLYDLTGWMQRKGFTTLEDVRGLLSAAVASQGSHTSGGWVREGYLNALQKATAKYGPDS